MVSALDGKVERHIARGARYVPKDIREKGSWRIVDRDNSGGSLSYVTRELYDGRFIDSLYEGFRGGDFSYVYKDVDEETKSQSEVDVKIRWFIRRDIPEALEIEWKSFEFSWTSDDFLCSLRQRNCIHMAAEYNDQILGYMVYELYKGKLNILNFAVHPEVRRKKVGTQMVDKLVDKLSPQRRKEIMLEVRETNLKAQLFFREQGFKATGVLRNHYDDTEEDAYLMRYRLSEADSYGNVL